MRRLDNNHMSEHEYQLHRGAPVALSNGAHIIPQADNDRCERIHNYDNQDLWTIEVYGNGRITRFLEQSGATEKQCLHDGRLFVLDARQLIEALVAMSGLIVEFRTRRKPQYSGETKQRQRERIAAINAQK
jgi:hypothetical protein